MNLVLPPRRGAGNVKGRTAVIDFGPDSSGWTGPVSLADLLDCVGCYIDYAKIYAVNALLIPSDALERIVAVYSRAGIRTFSGGILFEWAYLQGKTSELTTLLRKLGIEGLEISENYIRLSEFERNDFIKFFCAEGFEVIYEFGRKTPDAPLEVHHLADIVSTVREAGATHVILEQSEIDLAVAKKPTVLERIVEESWISNVFFEVDPTKFPQSHVAQIERFGAQVNLANVAVGQALRLEGLRRGVGRGVDYAMFKTGEL